MNTFRVTRVYHDAAGESHFAEDEYPLTDKGAIGSLSEQVQVKSLIFRTVPPTYDFDFHNAPQKQFIVLLDGSIEIETSLGEKRVFNAGEVIKVEDTEGKGHRTRNLIPVTRHSVFITYE
ncbi:hypothetical protein SAMN05421788_102248 [Filimonas lacunae]|uniref:Cupin domain-containing protein n=1 Tax=Filimonas lacunae TaxID=477680 RepID=A0A173MI88_9BACT|nr:hypothetical protein [Filimonas lacunae]BAV07128.1 hypothetical protein FLA_3148 [Filimonas lacunae]SIS94661.1 hypothetical protein SAMN05421788_102248 [Filimonas lacunae]